MTPPCLNCHGGSSSSPYSKENGPYHWDQGPLPTDYPESSTNVPPCKSECSAEPYWLDGLEKSYPDLQPLPFWVRGNFEKTLKAMRHAQGKGALPFRMDIENSHLEAELYPYSSATGIGSVDLHLDAEKNASLQAHLQVHDNRIELFMQSLVEFHGIELGIGTPRIISLRPEKIATDAAGHLHFLSQPHWIAAGVLNIFGTAAPQELRYPRDPECQYFWELKPYCPPPWSRPAYPNDDLLLTDRIPKTLRDPHFGFVPASLNLEDLLLKVLDLVEQGKNTGSTKKESSFNWRNLLSLQNLKMGSRVLLNLEDLRDLFVPGVVDLGPSKASVQVFRDLKDSARLIVDNFEINLEAMDYGKAALGKRGPFQLHEAHLRPGPEVEDPQLALMKPGIHVTYHEFGGIEVKANLEAELSAKIPLLGEMKFSGQILFAGQIDKTPQGLKFNPNFKLVLQNAQLRGSGGKPLISDLRLRFASESIQLGDPFTKAPNYQTPPLGDFVLSGKLGGAYPSELSGQLFLNFDEKGGLDLSDWSLRTQLNIDHPKKGAANERKMVEGGKIYLQKAKPESEENPIEVRLGMDQLYFPTPAGPLSLKDIKAQLSLDPFRITDLGWIVGIENLSVEANPQGASKSIVQGGVSIKQSPKTHLLFLFNPQLRQATVQNVDLSINAQQIYVLPPALRKLLDPSIASFGLDGHLAGYFTMNFSEKQEGWNGSGKLGLKGDERGDVYFLNDQGKRVGPPLLRNTQWEVHRISRLSPKGQYALGKFFLTIEPNVGAFTLSSQKFAGAPSSDPTFFGGLGQKLHASGNNFVMPYDNMPWTFRGFQNIIVQYLQRLCHADTPCHDKASRKGLQ